MKPKAIYYRKKGNKIVVEGLRNRKTVYLFTLPSPEKLLHPSVFPLIKITKIIEKIARLDFKKERGKKKA